MASPMSQAPRHRLLGFDREDNEIADFVDDRAECVAADALGRFPQLLRGLGRPCTAAYGYRLVLHSSGSARVRGPGPRQSTPRATLVPPPRRLTVDTASTYPRYRTTPH